MSNTEKKISNWRTAYYDSKKLFYYFIVAISILGNLIDVLQPKAGLTYLVIYVNAAYIVLCIIIFVLFLLKILDLYNAAGLTLYSLMFNIFFCLALSINEPNFEIYYMRDMMILGILLIPTGFILHKSHVLVFGALIFLQYTYISFFTYSAFLHDNYPLLLLVLFSYTFWVYYIMHTLEGWLIKQNKLIDKLEHKNKSLDKKREQLNKINNTKDRIFSIMAHDLKNPFNSIIGFSDLILLKHKQLDEQKKEKYLKIINHSAIESETLLNNILSWATSQTEDISFNPQKIDINKLFENLKSYFKANCEAKEIELITEIIGKQNIIADGNMIITVLRNLISNAIKYTPHKGIVNVKSTSEKDKFTFIITDTGVGMSEANKKNLFNEIGIIQTKGTDSEKGTGLGLIICKDLIERHKGELIVESKINKGTSFKFTIPQG